MAFYLKYKVDNNDRTALITADSLITLLTNNTDISENVTFSTEDIYKRSYNIYTIDDITESLFTNFLDIDDAEMMISFTRPTILAMFLLKQSNALTRESAKNLIRMADGSSRIERLVALLVVEKEYEKTLYKLYNAVGQLTSIKKYGPKVKGNNYLLRYLSNQTIEDNSTWDQTIFASDIRNDIENNPYLIIKKMLEESNTKVTLPGIAFYRTFQACKYPDQMNGYADEYDEAITDYNLAILKSYSQNDTVTAIDIVSDLPFRFKQSDKPGQKLDSDLDTIKSVCNSFASTFSSKGESHTSWGTNMFLDQVQTTDAVREVIFHALLAMNPDPKNQNSDQELGNTLNQHIINAVTGFLKGTYSTNDGIFNNSPIYLAVKDHGYFSDDETELYKKFITLDDGEIIWSHRKKSEVANPTLPYIYPRTFPYWWNVGGGWKYSFAGAGNANIAKSVIACVIDAGKIAALIAAFCYGQAAKLAAKLAKMIAPGASISAMSALGALGLVSSIVGMFTNTPNNIDKPYQISSSFTGSKEIAAIDTKNPRSPLPLNSYFLTERDMSFNMFNSRAEKKQSYLKPTYESVLNKVQPFHEMFTERIFTNDGEDRSAYVDDIMRSRFINNSDRNSAELWGYAVLTESSIFHKVSQFQETLSQFQQVEFYNDFNSQYNDQKGLMWNKWLDDPQNEEHKTYFTRNIEKSSDTSSNESKMLYTVFNKMLDGSEEAKHFLSAIKTADFYINHAQHPSDSDKDLLPTEVVTELARIFQLQSNPQILAYMAETYENLNKQKLVRDGQTFYPVDTTTTSIKFVIQDLNMLLGNLSSEIDNLKGSQKLAFLYARAFLKAYLKSISNLIDQNNIYEFDDTDEKFYSKNPMKLDGIAESMLEEMIPKQSADFDSLSQEMKEFKTYMNSLVKVKNYIDFYRNVTEGDTTSQITTSLYAFMESDAYRILKEGV